MPDTAKITLNVFDSTRQPINPDLDLLVTLRDGNQNVPQRDFHRGPALQFEVPFFNNFGDSYTVIVAAKKRHDAGFAPVKVSPNLPQTVDLMLLPKKNRYDFTAAAWDKLKKSQPALPPFLARGAAGESAARALYDELMDKDGDALAGLLNITTALADIILPVGRAFDYFKEFVWDQRLIRRDRFFAFADAQLVTQVRQAVAQGAFAPAFGFDVTHPGATSSFKQQQFGEANVQLTFHEHERRTIAGVECVKVEPDMDYFRDPLAHFFIEVIPNFITQNKTDPKAVYVLRWIAGRHAGVPEFNPPYTLEAA